VEVENAADQVTFWIPVGKPPPGTRYTNPSRKLWVWMVVLPFVGTSVDHLLLAASQVVVAAVAVDEKVTTAFGTGKVHCINVESNVPVHWLEVDGKAMLALVTYSLTLPLAGSPFTLRAALLNQM
jgi:hypothetical protein